MKLLENNLKKEYKIKDGCSVGPTGAQAPTEKKNTSFLFKRKINKFLNNSCQIINKSRFFSFYSHSRENIFNNEICEE